MSLDSSEYDKGLDTSKNKAVNFGKSLKTAFKVGAAAIAAVTTAVGGLSAAFIKGTADVADYGDNIDKMSQKMGLSATAYQEWDAVMRHSGTTIESLQAGMKTLANAVENDNKAFRELGITQEQIAQMSNEELFSATITALQNVQNETERTYLAGQLLGRGATELGALLNLSAEETQAMKDRVHELGGVMSDEAVKAAAAYKDSLQDMQTAFGGLKRQMSENFLPSLTKVMDGLTKIFSGGGGFDEITQGINEFAAKLSAAIPRIVEVGSQIVTALAKAITDNLPTLIQTVLPVLIKALITIVAGIVKELPAILKSIVTAVISVIDEIGHAIAEKVPALAFIFEHLKEVVAVLTGVFIGYKVAVLAATIAQQALNLAMMATPTGLVIAGIVALVAVIGILIASTDNIGEAFESAFNAIGEGISAIGEKIGQVVSKIANFFSKLFSSAMGWVQEFVNIGVRIVEGIWEGITAAWNWLVEKWTKLWDSLLGWIKDLLGIHSPSTVFADEIGKNMALGVGVGWEKAFGGVRKDIEKSLDFGEQNFSVSGSVNGAAGAGSIAAASEQSINVDFTLRLDDGTILQKLAHRIYPYNENETALRGAVL